MKRINTREDLIELANQLNISGDWHEPDSYQVTAKVQGTSFDNAGFWPYEEYPDLAKDSPWSVEMYVELRQHGEPVAVVNLATLFAWATGYDADTAREGDEPCGCGCQGA